VILPAIRRAFLASVPPGTPLLIVAPDAAGYAALAAERNDPAVAVRPLRALAAGESLDGGAIADVLLEGLDELDAPATALRLLRAQAPQARLHALVANAAHLAWLAAFYGGAPPPGGHPLVRSEIEPLLRAGGWGTPTITPIADGQLPPPGAVPVEIAAGRIRFQLTAAPLLERGRTAGYLVVAGPR
jgi:hypothetical protein